MKFLIAIIAIILIGSGFVMRCAYLSKENSKKIKPNQSFYNLEAKNINGENISMSVFKDKKVLIVNVASECGFTPQYESLQKLYDLYKDDLYILAFPSNDFLKQEPGSNQEIEKFCQVNYGIKFDIFEKISVKGNNLHPIYEWLSNSNLNGWNNQPPIWNFSKYLIDKDGSLIGFWGPKVDPLSSEILDKIK